MVAGVMFRLDPAFVATSHEVSPLALCDARLQANARFPWIVLVPRIAGAVELEDLDAEQLRVLTGEVLAAGRAVRAIGHVLGRPVSKLNVGQLGNVTPQLHVHVVGRWPGDAAWPGPVWGSGVPEAYGAEALEAALDAGRKSLGS